MGSVAIAGIPDPSQSTVDGDLHVGNARGLAIIALPNVRGTVPDGYRVVVRDGLGSPLNGVTVSMHFTGTGVRPHGTQTGGQVAACGLNTIAKATNVSGEVIFFPGTAGQYTSATPDVQIRAGSVLLTQIRYRSVDLVASFGGAVPSVVDGQDVFVFKNLLGTTNPAADFASEGPSIGIVDGFDANVLRTEVLCGVLGGPVPAPCSLTQCP
jgi:hypothetical protein